MRVARCGSDRLWRRLGACIGAGALAVLGGCHAEPQVRPRVILLPAAQAPVSVQGTHHAIQRTWTPGGPSASRAGAMQATVTFDAGGRAVVRSLRSVREANSRDDQEFLLGSVFTFERAGPGARDRAWDGGVRTTSAPEPR